MAQNTSSSFEDSYQLAHASGLLPGVALRAESRKGARGSALETLKILFPDQPSRRVQVCEDCRFEVAQAWRV